MEVNVKMINAVSISMAFCFLTAVFNPVKKSPAFCAGALFLPHTKTAFIQHLLN
jgi:hypothetical protein